MKLRSFFLTLGALTGLGPLVRAARAQMAMEHWDIPVQCAKVVLETTPQLMRAGSPWLRWEVAGYSAQPFDGAVPVTVKDQVQYRKVYNSGVCSKEYWDEVRALSRADHHRQVLGVGHIRPHGA